MKRSDNQPSASTLTLEPNDARRLAALCGQFDEHIRLIEKRLDVDIRSRDNFFAAYGDATAASQATAVIYNLYQPISETGQSINFYSITGTRDLVLNNPILDTDKLRIYRNGEVIRINEDL